MTDTPTTAAPAHSAFLVLAALADLGEATAAAVAEHTELGYSTVTPKLRAWETSGHAERVRSQQNQTLWRLTATGLTTTATSGEHADAAPPPSALRGAADETAIIGEPTPGGATALNADAPTPPGVANTAEHEDDDIPQDAEHDEQGGEPRESGPVRATEITPAAQDATEPKNTAEHQTVQPEPAASPVQDTPGGDPAPQEADIAAAASPPPADSTGTDGDLDALATPPSGDGDATSGAASQDRRPSGSLRGAILDILEAHPGQGYKVRELCKLIDRANEDTGARKASAGAVVNAAHKLVEKGRVTLLVEKPATFGLPTADA